VRWIVDDLIVGVGGSVAWFSSDGIFSNKKLRRIDLWMRAEFLTRSIRLKSNIE
jgi:hypothetical protein